MHLKSTSATPILIVVSVTPGPSVFTIGACAVELPVPAVVVDVGRRLRAAPARGEHQHDHDQQRNDNDRRDDLRARAPPRREPTRTSPRAQVRPDSALVHRARVGRAARRSCGGAAARRRAGTARRGRGACRRCASRPAGPSTRSVVRIALCNARRSSASIATGRPRGSIPARQSVSSTSRLPSPAMRAWSISTALIGAVRLPSA